MEEIKTMNDAWEGDLIEQENTIYRVIDADFEVITLTKKLRCVKAFTKKRRLNVYTFYC